MKEQEETILPELPSRNILIVVDMQYDFIDGSLANPDAQKIVAPICELIKSGKYDDIVMTRDSHTILYLNTPEGKRLPVEHCLVGTKGWCVHDDIIKACRESGKSWEFLDKPTFGYKDWEKCALQTNDRITLVGTCTDICVVSNALILKAVFPTIELSVIGNLCAGLTKEKHEAALETMRSCQIDVVYTEPQPEETLDQIK